MNKGFTPHHFYTSPLTRLKLFLNKRKSGGGFTLVEILITITVFVLISIAIFNILFFGQRFAGKGNIRAELLQNGRIILERMTREIRQAEEIVTELSDDEIGATTTIIFQDGHDISFIHYIHYFRDGISGTIKREDLAYYFSISGDSASSSTYVSWNAEPPEDETLETIILESPRTIGEYVANLELWGLEVINISMTLKNQDQTIGLRTKIFGRNL